MKNVFFAAAICLALVSCGDDDNQSSNVSVEGAWQLTGVTLDTPYDLNNNGTTSINLMAETGCFNNTTLVFANGTAILAAEDVSVFYDASVPGGLVAQCLPIEVITGTYTVSNGQVSLGDAEDELVFSRNGNTLTTYNEAGITVPVQQQGGETFVDVGATYTFTKQ